MSVAAPRIASEAVAAIVRPARAGDLDALVALENAAFSGDRATRRAIRHAIGSASMTVLAATMWDGGSELLVGAATIERRRGSRIARLSSISVSPACAGQGLGSLILDAVEADAIEHGRNRLRLEVRDDNGAGIRLYERRGYRRWATKPDYYEDGTEALCYEKSLVGAP